MLNHLLQNKFFCGLDIGAQRIKAGILRVDDPRSVELLGALERKTYGFREYTVSNLNDLSDCIHKTLNTLTKKTGVKIKEIQLGVTGELVSFRQTSTMIPLVDRGSKVISSRDLKAVNNPVRLLGVKIDEQVIHDLPQYYQIDDDNTTLNPLGLYGRKLGVQTMMILSDVNRIRNITKAINQAGYEVSDVFFTSYTSSEVALTEEDKQNGCVLIDMGSEVTSILIFVDGILYSCAPFKIGGNTFTRRIAEHLNLPIDLAEDIKKSYAMALNTDHQNQEEILVKKDDMYLPIKKELIFQAINTTVEEIIDHIQTAISSSGVMDRIHSGVVMIGGGALLPGLLERIGQATHYTVRLGSVNGLAQNAVHNGPLFVSVIGLAQYALKKNGMAVDETEDSLTWPRMVRNKVRELYHEYF